MGKEYLIDTNVVIYMLKGNLPEKVLSFMKPLFDSTPNFSVINKIEMLSHNDASPEETRSVQKLIKKSTVHHLNDSVIEMTIRVRKKYSMKLPDAIIASTAIVHNLILATRNTKDFEKIVELEIYNPFQ
ncbi:MAG: type II toxin-antitoxin system VapC family toxin [Bacteroidia bacterium]|nr:type II toxin-antitoxin system VapC family toxin [Bacteroidia bacterium]